ncbi:uncharacterized protein yc1106_01479 [Curvularia clavata]|uniref:Uncharacterized protein n=1 Tax=Curvularia clavata TaxID=95742 RepID=A0A9Q8Z1Z6_CURCL|nr:uncharacterized protein yc1106_01479 [Curvularia clavata]
MTAPPAELSFFAATLPPLHFAYPSPASTVDSDTTSHYSPMSPRSDSKSLRPRKTSSVSPTEAPPKNEGLCWIVGGTPADFKSRDTMHKVRKTAMVSYLKTEKSKENAKSRAGSEGSAASPQSGGESQSRQPRKKSTNNANKSTPPNTSSTPQTLEYSPPVSDTRVARRSLQSTIPQAPIVVPIMPDINYPFDHHNMPPLVSIGESLDPFRTMFQSNNPRVSVVKLKHHCRTYFGTRSLGRLWIPKCLDHPHTFLSTLFMAAIHEDVIMQREVESLETAALRQDIIHLVGGNLTDPDKMVDDANIIAVSQLILGEVIGRTETSLTFHQVGIERMIRQRGGLNKLGMNGLLASAVSWAHLATAVLRESTPTLMYVEYCIANSTKEYPPNATVPESPLYCPRGKYVTIERSRSVEYQPNTLKLVNEMRAMIAEFLKESRNPRRNPDKLAGMFSHIAQYPTIHQMPRDTVLTAEDWKYEAIRITAVVLAHAMNHRTKLSDAIVHACPTRKPSTVYASSLASHSSESLPSPLDMTYSTPDTEYSTSPSFRGSFNFGQSTQQPGFPFTHRPSDASTRSHYPSFSSASSSASHSRCYTTLSDVRDALEKSNLSDCWGDLAGILLWIGLVMGAASHHEKDKLIRRYYSALTIRACIMLCFEHPQAMHATMLKMTDIVDALDKKDEAQVARKRTKA